MDRGSKRRAGATVNGPVGSVPLWKRRGVACLAPDLVGHEASDGCVPWDHTGPMTSELQRARLYENSAQFDRIDAKRKNAKNANSKA